MIPLFSFFGIKESDESDSLVKKGQFWPQRSHKGHLKVICGYVLYLAPFVDHIN